MTITAKFPSRCARCNGAITVGQQIDWVRGEKPMHAGCDAPVARAAAGTLPGTYSRPTPRFTCRRCGDHRDTTISGRCDDCDA